MATHDEGKFRKISDSEIVTQKADHHRIKSALIRCQCSIIVVSTPSGNRNSKPIPNTQPDGDGNFSLSTFIQTPEASGVVLNLLAKSDRAVNRSASFHSVDRNGIGYPSIFRYDFAISVIEIRTPYPLMISPCGRSSGGTSCYL